MIFLDIRPAFFEFGLRSEEGMILFGAALIDDNVSGVAVSLVAAIFWLALLSQLTMGSDIFSNINEGGAFVSDDDVCDNLAGIVSKWSKNASRSPSREEAATLPFFMAERMLVDIAEVLPSDEPMKSNISSFKFSDDVVRVPFIR